MSTTFAPKPSVSIIIGNDPVTLPFTRNKAAQVIRANREFRKIYRSAAYFVNYFTTTATIIKDI